MTQAAALLAEDEVAPDPTRGRLIVDAACALLDEAGLEGLTIRAVLARTGLSRRAFYERFDGKDDLVLAVFEQTIRHAAQHFEQESSALPDPLDRLRYIVLGVVIGGGMREGGPTSRGNAFGAAMSREHLRLADARPDDLHIALDPLIALIAHILSDGIAAGSVRAADTRRLATLVYNLVSTTVHTQLLTEEQGVPDPTQRRRLADEIWDFCRRAVIA